MKNGRKPILWTVGALGAALLAPGAEARCAGAQAQEPGRIVFVAAPGTKAPRGAVVATSVQRGIDLAGKFRQQGDDVLLLIGGGVYPVEETLELTAERIGKTGGTLRIAAAPGEAVFLQGGKEIPLACVGAVPASEERVSPALRDSLRVIDLDRAGVKALTPLHPVGFSRPALPAWSELFVNGRPQTLSRWPNDSMALIGEVLNPGSIPRDGDTQNRGGTFRYQGDRPARWRFGEPLWIAGYFAHGYADDMLPLAAVDTLQKTLTLAQATMYGLMSGADYRRWYAVNLLQEVDRPGEYYLDQRRNRIWFYPEGELKSLSVSLLGEPLMAIEGVEDVEVCGLTFECSRGIGLSMERTEHVSVRACRFRNLGGTAVSVGRGIEPFTEYRHEGTGVPASRMIGSLQQHIYAETTFNGQGGRGNLILDCEIYDVGAGGVSLCGGDRLSLEPGDNRVENCRIRRYNRVEKSYRPGIHLMGAGNRVSHCEISDAPSIGILIHGNDHLIEYNEIHRVCREVDDLGAVYYGRDPSEQGNRLMFNYIHHIDPAFRVVGIYQDDGSCGMYCYGNILYKAGRYAVMLGGGSDQSYVNNLIIDTPFGIHVDNRHEVWENSDQTEELFAKRLRAVNFQQEPYASRYPGLAGYLDENIRKPKRNAAHGNLFYRVRSTLRDFRNHDLPGELNSLDLYNNWMSWQAPGLFTDEAGEDWTMPDDSPVFGRIAGFRAIPFRSIGCSLPPAED